MKTIKTAMMILSAFAMAVSPAFADQSKVEKGKAQVHKVKRQARHKVNRLDERLCTGTKAECAGKQIKHRTGEAKEFIDDKAKEAKDTLDRDQL